MPETPEPVNPTPGSGDKPSLRTAARARRAGAAALFGARIGPILTANFMAAFSLPPRAVVAGYSPMRDEADIGPLLAALAARGHALCLPVVEAMAAPLGFRQWAPGDALAPGYQGIAEPAAGAAVAHPDVVLVPLLAFDRGGHRLGYGGGFYDRTLAGLRAAGSVLVVGIAFSAQQVDRLPGADHDQRLDAVLTEQGVIRFPKKDEA